MLLVLVIATCGVAISAGCWITSLRVKKEVKAEYENFEYRVIEKKYSSGKSYFIGESTKDGKVTILVDKAYRYDAVSMSRGFASVSGVRSGRIYYELLDKITAKTLGQYGSEVHGAVFKDPCQVKEIICNLRREAADRAALAAYSVVVSEGDCKCPT